MIGYCSPQKDLDQMFGRNTFTQSSEAMAEVGQKGCGCPIPRRVKDQVGWCPEQPGLMGGNPVHGIVVGIRLYLMSLPPQDIL